MPTATRRERDTSRGSRSNGGQNGRGHSKGHQNGRSRSRRNDESYINDPKEIQYIAKTIDCAVKAAQPLIKDGEIATIDDFADFLEQFSEQKCRRGIVMNLFGDDDDLSGCNFAFQDNPDQTTTSQFMMKWSKKLAKELAEEVDDPESYYTISEIEYRLGLSEEAEYDDDYEEEFYEEEDEENHRSTRSGRSFQRNQRDDDDDLIESFNDDNEPEQTTRREKLSAKSRDQQRSSKKQRKREDQDDEIVDLDDNSIPEEFKLPSVPKSQKAANKDQQSTKGQGSRSTNEVQRAAERVAQEGQTLDGLNGVGLTAQVADAAAKVGKAGCDRLGASSQQRQLAGVAKNLSGCIERHNNLVDHISRSRSNNGSDQPISEADQRVAKAKAELEAALEEQTEERKLAKAVNNTANEVAGSVNKLGKAVDSEFKPVPPVEFDPNASLSDQIKLLQKQVRQLSDRLDRLEEFVYNSDQNRVNPDAAKSQIKAPPKSPQTEAATGDQAIAAPVSSANEANTGIEYVIAQRQANQDNTACAKSLANFAKAYSALHPEESKNGIPFGATLTLKLERDPDTNSLIVSISDEQNKPAFLAFENNGSWKARSDLSHDQRNVALTLPQTKEALLNKELGQEFVQAVLTDPKIVDRIEAVSNTSKRFPIDMGAYQFIVSQDVEDSNEFRIIGFDPDQPDHSIFEAVSTHPHKAPDVRVNNIPNVDMEMSIAIFFEPEDYISLRNFVDISTEKNGNRLLEENAHPSDEANTDKERALVQSASTRAKDDQL